MCVLELFGIAKNLSLWNDDRGVDWRTLRKEEETYGGRTQRLSVLGWRESLKERKKEKRQPKRGMGEEDRVPTCASRIWKDDQGHRGSPAPDKGHERLAARCSVLGGPPTPLAVSSQSSDRLQPTLFCGNRRKEILLSQAQGSAARRRPESLGRLPRREAAWTLSGGQGMCFS